MIGDSAAPAKAPAHDFAPVAPSLIRQAVSHLSDADSSGQVDSTLGTDGERTGVCYCVGRRTECVLVLLRLPGLGVGDL